MRHILQVGQAPIAIHPKECVYFDASANAVGTITVPGEGVQIAITAGASYTFGGYVVKREIAVVLTQGTMDVRVSTEGIPNGIWTPLTPPYTLTAADDQKAFALTAAGTVTVPAGLVPRPSVAFMPPPTGNLSLTGVLNGSSQTLTRARTANPSGVALNPYVDVDGFGLSGS